MILLLANNFRNYIEMRIYSNPKRWKTNYSYRYVYNILACFIGIQWNFDTFVNSFTRLLKKTNACLCFLIEKGLGYCRFQNTDKTLEYNVIRKHSLDIFSSYLTSRKYIVQIGNDYSEAKIKLCGVPRGPLLFTLYINNRN